ncbi:hypothetical protein DH86_00001996 [Scytalidium sp. 3C]|nr:hypothetical protein DH86_00001996 [Scytalidium sp. 3C]
MAAADAPKLIRPVPRRPFEHDSKLQRPPSPTFSSKSFQDAGDTTPSASVSRTHSILNLTSSTLLGIYSPTGYSEDRDEISTPWGTGAETPALEQSYRKLSIPSPQPAPISARTSAFSLFLRTVLLFCMGTLYGVLVRHLHDDRQLAPVHVEGIIRPSRDWRYLTFWGVAGVAWGTLLPWVDTIWEEDVKGDASEDRDRKAKLGFDRSPSPDVREEDGDDGFFGADWTPVVRSIGAFVGIAFAIASLTLALVNPVLWYLIDRSTPGLFLSTIVGAIGTAVLLGINADVMPNPAPTVRNFSMIRNSSATLLYSIRDLSTLGAALSDYVDVERVEVAIWIISVLFCSCVCFGNIGRMLALNINRRKDGDSLRKSQGNRRSSRIDDDRGKIRR